MKSSRKIASALVAILATWGSVKQAHSQVSFNGGDHNLEVTGALYGFYHMRFLPGTTNAPTAPWWPFSNNNDADLRKNRFEMRNIMVTLEGRYARQYEWQVQLNFAKLLAQTNDGFPDVENPPIMDAYFSYVGNDWVKIKAGFQKIPYSRASLTTFSNMPFIQRAEFARCDVYSRRDIGLFLYNDFWKQRINVYAGAFTGQGESALLGDNDRSGMYEYVARADIAYPSRYRYHEIDDKVSPVPMVQFGINGRTNQRENPYTTDADEYGLKRIQGIRQMWGMDFSAQYMGWSTQVEWHDMTMWPRDKSYLQGYEDFTNYFKASGLLAQVNYFHKPWASVFSIRYDRFNSNDLVGQRAQPQNYDFWTGSISGLDFDSRAVAETICYGYTYQLRGWNSALRFQYWQRLKKDESKAGRLTDDQVRIGWQYLFR